MKSFEAALGSKVAPVRKADFGSFLKRYLELRPRPTLNYYRIFVFQLDQKALYRLHLFF